MAAAPESGLQLRSLIKPEGILELSLQQVPVSPPAEHEVVVQIEASPINPSDQGLLFGGADMTVARAAGSPEMPIVVAPV